MMTTTRRWRRRRVCLFIFVINMLENLRTSRRRRLAGAETSLRDLQGTLNPRCDRVRAAKHASRDRFYLLERRHGLAEIVERGTVLVERPRVNFPHPRRVPRGPPHSIR
jgi:hypothetical protein